MKVLVVGGGGREHALCRGLRASPRLTRLVCAPGNAGIADEAETRPVAADDIDALVGLAQEIAADLVVVGPEAPLVAGLVDRLDAAGIAAVGPSAAAARLEGSKAFMKAICARHGIPTAGHATFTDADAARAHVRDHGAPIVVKADGLAAGKGVTICTSVAEADSAIRNALEHRIFGEAGATVVLEEMLTGEEVSFFALVDGTTVLPLGTAQDHKRVGERDTGPNTGGMGAYAPTPVVDAGQHETIMRAIITPLVAGMAADGSPFRGVLFAGLMLTADGPRLLEVNVRFGDPECQVLLSRLQSDLLDLLAACAHGRLDTVAPVWDPRPALGVVLAANGYPGTTRKGTIIGSLGAARTTRDVAVFHAGTDRNEHGDLVAVGGRVLTVVARGDSVTAAAERAYAAIDTIDWTDGFCRRDIGWRAIERERIHAGRD